MIEAGAVPVAEHAAELAVAPVFEQAAEHVVAVAAGFVVGVGVVDVVVVVAAGLAELEPVGAVCCSFFLVG